MAEGCGATCWLVTAAAVILVLAFLRKILLLLRGDADLTLQSKSLVPNYFREKVVWVTGASSGIGEELCRQLSAHGAKVILSSRSKDKLLAVKEELHDPANARVVIVDMSDKESVLQAVEEATAQFGRIDILINNAGTSTRCPFMETSDEVGRKVIDTNFFNAVLMTKRVLAGMIKQGGGQIVNNSSMAGKAGYPCRAYYAASKHAIIGLMDCLRFELEPQNIHITNVCPGLVRTRASHNAFMGTGECYGKSDPVLESGMGVQRCAHLMLVAASNRLKEAWVAEGKALWLLYFSQYFPATQKHLLSKYTKKIMDEFKKTN